MEARGPAAEDPGLAPGPAPGSPAAEATVEAQGPAAEDPGLAPGPAGEDGAAVVAGSRAQVINIDEERWIG